MAYHKALTPVDATLLQKYAPTLLSAAILILGGLQVLVSSGHTLVDILQFVTIVITSLTTFGFTGWWKTGLEAAGVIVVAILPFAIDQTVTWANILLIVIAIVKALATHFGVVLRSDVAPVQGAAATPNIHGTLSTPPASDG